MRVLGLIACALWFTNSSSACAQTPLSDCQKQDIETLTTQLVKDLPNYTNRVNQKSRRLTRSIDIYSYVLVAGKAEFAPLSLGPGEYLTRLPVA